MDNPHPLETLGDSGAYGPVGSISRYHNPDHYTRVRAVPLTGHIYGTLSMPPPVHLMLCGLATAWCCCP